VTLTIKHVAESLVQRQIKFMGYWKESVETHARHIYGTPMNSDSSFCDLVLAKQFESDLKG
jgi:hypothetical protein